LGVGKAWAPANVSRVAAVRTWNASVFPGGVGLRFSSVDWITWFGIRLLKAG